MFTSAIRTAFAPSRAPSRRGIKVRLKPSLPRTTPPIGLKNHECAVPRVGMILGSRFGVLENERDRIDARWVLPEVKPKIPRIRPCAPEMVTPRRSNWMQKIPGKRENGGYGEKEHSHRWKAKAQYKSAIWCQNEEQYSIAMQMIEQLERDGKDRLRRMCMVRTRVR